MSNMFEINAEVRTDLGKGASRRLRHTEKLPAIVYGGGKDPVSITLEQHKVRKALENEAFYSHILDLKIAGKAEKVVLKDIHRHPAKPIVLHMDFQRVSAKDKLHMNIPLHYINEGIALGVKQGGIVSHTIIDVEIKCLPKDLPEFIEVDIADLDLDQAYHLSDISMPKGVELVALSHGPEHDLPIISIHMPKRAAEPSTETDIGDSADESDSSAE